MNINVVHADGASELYRHVQKLRIDENTVEFFTSDQDKRIEFSLLAIRQFDMIAPWQDQYHYV